MHADLLSFKRTVVVQPCDPTCLSTAPAPVGGERLEVEDGLGLGEVLDVDFGLA